MDTDLDEDQGKLRQSARDFLEARVPTSVVRAFESDPVGYDVGLWKEMAALGWHGVVIPAELGGSGLGFVELTILAEEMGRALCPSPYLPTMLATLAILDGGSEAQRRQWLPAIAAGDAVWSVAIAEPEGSWDLRDVRLPIAPVDGGHRIDGTKMFVQNADAADWFVVVGVAGDGSDRRPLAVALQRHSDGIEVEQLETIAADHQARVRFDAVVIPHDQALDPDGTGGWLDLLAAKAAIVECAYLVGLARKDLELAVEHAKNRVQFGQPIGAFQAIQHACANMLTDVDGAWLATYRAAWGIETAQPDALLFASIAKAWTSDASSRVVSMCQQVSGAMGFTRDYDSQLYFRRQKRAELFWGDGDFHRERVASHMTAEHGA